MPVDKLAAERETLADWIKEGRPEWRPTWLGVEISRLKELDALELLAPRPPLSGKTGAASLIAERRKTHGDWKAQSKLAQRLKAEIHEADDREAHTPLKLHQMEALEMIAVKISRIITGNADEPDHWDDISGYALLGKQGHDGAKDVDR